MSKEKFEQILNGGKSLANAENVQETKNSSTPNLTIIEDPKTAQQYLEIFLKRMNELGMKPNEGITKEDLTKAMEKSFSTNENGTSFTTEHLAPLFKQVKFLTKPLLDEKASTSTTAASADEAIQILANKIAGNFSENLITEAAKIAATVTSLASGIWTSPTIWSAGRVPNNTDNAVISANQTVTIPAGITGNTGSLELKNNATLRLNSGSKIRIGN